MTGVEHYRAAERILEDIEGEPLMAAEDRDALTVSAQAHATLALVAATAPCGVAGDPAAEAEPAQYLGSA